MTIPILPTINASLNFLAGVFLFSGWLAIKGGNKKLHQTMMTCALISSAVFLACYVTYHAMMHGVVTRYQGTGIKRLIYFSILGTHTPLAMIIVPFSIAATLHAVKGNFSKHTAITRWLLPVWMYVSVTGVIIYLMLYVWR
jgi:putative membrane protein